MKLNTPPKMDEHAPGDEELIVSVRDALQRYNPTHMWGDSIEIDARNGHVTLSGVVRSQTAKETAEHIARQVRGVRSVENRLVADADVEIAIGEALAADVQTRVVFPGILVGVLFGVAILKGTVPSAQVKECVEQIVRAVPGVRSVDSQLLTPPSAAPLRQGTPTGQGV